MKPQKGTQNWLKPPNRQTIIDPLYLRHRLVRALNSLLNVASYVFILFSAEFSVIKLSIAFIFVRSPVHYYCPRTFVCRFDNYVLSFLKVTKCWSFIAAAASEPEANERGSSLISRRLHYRACNHFLLLKARNCGYARMEDLGCAVVCRKELWLCANRKI